MAIYHLSVKTIGRKQGRSSTAAAAYRAGCEIADERTGEVHDYSRKAGVESTEIIAPANAPEWAHDRSQLWNAVEISEKRKDARCCREVVLALPNELDANERKALARAFVKEQMVDRGMVADLAFHEPNTKGDERNHHCHVLLTTRAIDADGFGKKERSWNDKELVETWRAAWATHQNEALAQAGHNVQVDHRSYEAQGIERVGTVHMGPVATAMERRGQESTRGNTNRQIMASNDEIIQTRATIIDLEAARKERDKPQPIKTDPRQPLHERMKHLVDVIAKGTWLGKLKELVVNTLRSGIREVEDASLIDEVFELQKGKASLNTAIEQTTVGGMINTPEGQSLVILHDDVDQRLKPLEAAAQAERIEREAKAKAEVKAELEARFAREAEERQRKQEADPEYQRQKRLEEANARVDAMRKSVFDRSVIIEYQANQRADALTDEKLRVDKGLSEVLESHQRCFPEKPKGLFQFGAKKAYERDLEAWEATKQGIENDARLQKAKLDEQLDEPQMILRNKDIRYVRAREQISKERPADYQKALDAKNLIAQEEEHKKPTFGQAVEAKEKELKARNNTRRNRSRGGGIGY